MAINNLSKNTVLKGQDLKFSILIRFLWMTNAHQEVRQNNQSWGISSKGPFSKEKEIASVCPWCIDAHGNKLLLWTMFVAWIARHLGGWWRFV